MKSVVELRNWVAEQLRQFSGNNDVDYVLHYIRRNTDHPCYTDDPVYLKSWDLFLKNIDCSVILRNKLR
jgi:hypothetical protein